ncbi:heme-dependent oxidative N-demethylase subunit alpha family protein, partial [Phenylobacterium sp.]|uniref:heme-dependent oxidative N-demethylase subunit alpha family protein n=1 Tax=Phenylobacterium sp. TaxID=1871053 RepID=UPI002718FED6
PAAPVIRWNWSIYGDDRRAHPDPVAADARRFGPGARAEQLFFRAERQTLRKLPRSGDILFTIRIYIDPIAGLERHPDAAGIAAALIDQLGALTAEQLAYKGLAVERERLLARLGEIGAGGT